MAAAALFRDGMNNVQATLIEQCMEADELEDAMNYAFDLLNKGYVSTYHCGIAHLAIASISITQAHAGHATPDIHYHLRSALECFQRLIFHFNTSPSSESIPEEYLQKLVCCEARALELKEQFRGWTRQKFGEELEELECK